MEESISSRTRSSIALSESLKNWKICKDNFKVPRRTASKISSQTKTYKNNIISIINAAIDNSMKKYEISIHELNYLQSGHTFVLYKKLQTANDLKQDTQNVNPENDEYESSKIYFLDDSEDSDPEYIESDEIIKRVNAERYILNRVEELKKTNLWSLKMMSRKPDPPQPTFHWDLLLKEMKWLQGNISNMKQVKRTDARKIAMTAAKFVKEKETQMMKNNKEETIKAKKHCLNISKMIKEWWKQMQKIVSAKQKFRLDAKRQEAINDHLGKVIETTQKYTEWLTEDLKLVTSADNDTSVDDDPDFQIAGELTDNEDTIAEDEMALNYNVEEEIEALKQQNEMSLDDILNELPADYLKSMVEENSNAASSIKYEEKGVSYKTRSKQIFSKSDQEITSDSKHSINKKLSKSCSSSNDEDSSEDYEDTIIEQEKCEEKNNVADSRLEINELMSDANIPIEELIKLYEKIHSVSDTNKENVNEIVDKNESEEDEDTSNISETDTNDVSDSESSFESSVDLGEVFNIEKSEIKGQDSNQFQGQFQEISEVAMSTQPRGFTLESAEVKVQIPFLLKYSLREYQHVGLDWMAAIYEKRLNGVLADEMGLGKTIQTIALLAYLSCEKGIWGPHLVVVPTSVVLNWEIEFKKWCPGFKILTYFGSFKERKEKRKGWTKTNAFHVCITSYKLAIQDCQAFKRKKWKYMILDEAQNIKNFKSQRWQTLLTFNSQRRLLLTGTPLQNNLMELWSLMHFLMPNIFQSHREFNEWFGSPLTGMIEGSSEYNDQLVVRLHKVLRPFILRRLKKDVEKQMPQKYEHLVMCSLSKRQRFLYDDFMSLTSTKEMLSSGQFMNIISILMQLRKVCNHPNLFEERPTISPFSISQEPIEYSYPRILLIDDVYENRFANGKPVLPVGINGLADIALNMPKLVSERICDLAVKLNWIEEVDNIHVSDWVTKFGEKFTDSPQATSFIPRDLIDYLEKSDNDERKPINLPAPLIYGLKLKRKLARNENQLPTSIINSRRKQRVDRLITIGQRNLMRCNQFASLGTDVIASVSITRNYKEKILENLNVGILKRRTLEEFIKDNIEIVDRVTFVSPAVLSCGVRMNTSARSLLRFNFLADDVYRQSVSSIPICLSRIRQNQLVQFPDTRLIEYDCGKLQTLVSMLKKLKSEGHRCLIFTQMTRMLDILEQFLSYHGYRYLRLDGTTKIEQRHIMMEQFNKDERIFVFILSTRSGGVGVNLTGADTVIFYDSDWNPTMDAQAQDRCHRIGQTRDVHIYRLISRMTIEENILKKANEKRHLNEMAIEGGQFNMSFFKSNTLQDIFQEPTGTENSIEDQVDSVTIYKTMRGRTVRWNKGNPIFNTSKLNMERQEKNENKLIDSTQLEAALEEVEDESDRLAAKITIAETKADLVEFDENVPWEDTEEGSIKFDDENKFRIEMESHLENFNAQLDPLQRFGVRWIEQSSENFLCTQLELENTQIENNKQAWKLDQIKALHEDQEEMKNIDEDDMLYIYGEYDPYAAQKEELEKLRKEEELQQLEKVRKEEELAKLEKDKAAVKAWAQEQHKNALKRKLDINSEDSSNNVVNSESLVRGPKLRKIIIPRLEYPDESITTVNTLNSYANDTEQPLPSSSSSSQFADSKSLGSKKKDVRSFWNTFSKEGFDNYEDLNNQSDSSQTKMTDDRTWKKSPLTDYCEDVDNGHNSSTKSSYLQRNLSELNFRNAHSVLDKDFDLYGKKSFPKPRRMGRPPWKNIHSIENQSGNSISQKSFPPSRRMGRPPWKNIKPNGEQEYNNNNFPIRKSLQTTRFRKSSHYHKLYLNNRSPNENIAPYCKESFNSSIFTNDSPKICENAKNGYHDENNVVESKEFVKQSVFENSIKSDFSIKKKRGRPSLAEMKRKIAMGVEGVKTARNRNLSESTITSEILNKKNSFKIPVKTLNGDHKLFSAPLLLLKTKPVFVVTRKIEDNHGNVYTQNLTYPIGCTESFNDIAAKLSSFASTATEK